MASLSWKAERSYLPVRSASDGMPADLAAITSNGVSPMIRSLVSGWASRAPAVRAKRTGLRTPKKPADQSMRAVWTPPPSSFLTCLARSPYRATTASGDLRPSAARPASDRDGKRDHGSRSMSRKLGPACANARDRMPGTSPDFAIVSTRAPKPSAIA